VSESVVRAKRGRGWFGAQSARSEASVRTPVERHPPVGGRSEENPVKNGRGLRGTEEAGSSLRRVHDPWTKECSLKALIIITISMINLVLFTIVYGSRFVYILYV
jgi:hypothetical protein